ncbi:hypothetical protein OUZ56_012031 [Daphnia magna]|uniref:Uncharacterized protein n=1 Tax=Daphnia magna TaxID=35525 RepID=A0ABQ9Z1U6_9CRUS|nr:hypothetical protein OUZ56_012031 [Daphnia magna]
MVDSSEKVAVNMRSPSVSVMQMLLFCIRIVWSTMYSNSDLDGRGSSFERNAKYVRGIQTTLCPIGVAVKLSPVGPTCMLLLPHFLSLTIRQHSTGNPTQNDPVIFFVLFRCLHVHPFQVAAGFCLVINV